MVMVPFQEPEYQLRHVRKGRSRSPYLPVRTSGAQVKLMLHFPYSTKVVILEVDQVLLNPVKPLPQKSAGAGVAPKE